MRRPIETTAFTRQNVLLKWILPVNNISAKMFCTDWRVHMSGKLPRLIVCCVVFLSSCNRSSSSPAAPVHPSAPHPESRSAVSEENRTGTLDFPGGSKFQTTLYDLKVIGQLRTVQKLPYYVLSGVGCQECDANVSVYIHSPSDGPMKDEGTQPRFDYPGRVISREDKSVISETRMFLGNCLVGHPNAVVWFERWLGDDKQWHKSVSLAEVRDDHLVLDEPKANAPRPGEAEDSVRKLGCRELSGVNQWNEP